MPANSIVQKTRVYMYFKLLPHIYIYNYALLYLTAMQFLKHFATALGRDHINFVNYYQG